MQTCIVEKLMVSGSQWVIRFWLGDSEIEVPWIEGPFVDDWRRIRIEMETERLPDELASFGRVRTKPTTKLGWEVGE